ncbi:MAG: phosphate transport system substrate-binding protein [Candidatus Azotimanducaceae bacterium]|jgi:phosphate transport system substrate-binding protein
MKKIKMRRNRFMKSRRAFTGSSLARVLILPLVLGSVLVACGGAEQAAETENAPAALEFEAVEIQSAQASVAASASATDTELLAYQRVAGISGNLSSIGSDTLANLMTLWTETFKRNYPSVNIQVQAAGSSTAPPALTEGTANFGPMSRAMKDKEIEAFETRHGYKPTAIRVAIDALAVYVHKDNPLDALSIAELDAVFSITRRCGAPASHDVWGALGLTGSWTERPIQLYGRNSVSGTYGYFKKVALCSGDFKPSVNEQPGSASVVQAAASSLNGIGYSGIGYITSDVKALALSTGGGPAVAATPENALNNTYPLSRYLYVYVNKKPNAVISPIELEFLKLVLSKEGQSIVQKDGYIPVSAEVAARELTKLQ